MKSLLSVLLAVCLVGVGCAASALAGCPRDAVVRVEVALDPASAGPELARELGGREALTAYETEIGRRLRVGSSGTGFLVNPNGAVITNAHVLLSGVRFRGLHLTYAEWDSMALLLEAVRDIWVSVGEGDQERSYLAVPVVIGEDLDLAVLQIVRPPGDETSFRCLPIGRAQDLAIGSPIRCCGFIDGEFRETRGEVLSFLHGRTVQEPMQIVRRTHPSTGEEIITVSGTSPGPLRRLQHSAAVGHGSSGSPILDERGSVVGVGYAYLSDRRPGAEGQDGLSGLNMAIASNVLRQFLLAHSISFEDAGP